MSIPASLETILKDVRFAIRRLRKNGGFTLAAVITLALGIGAASAVFTVINGVLIRPLTYPEPDRLVGVWHSGVLQGVASNRFNFSPTMYAAYQEQNQTFQDFGVWSNGAATLTGAGDPEQVRTLLVTRGILPALGVQPALGRWFTPDEDTPAGPETVILTHGYWRRRFGADESIIGRNLLVDSRPRQVVGVMPEGFRFLTADPEIILPHRFAGDLRPLHSNFNYYGLARLKPGVTLAQANADVARMLPLWDEISVSLLRLAPALRLLKEQVVGDIGSLLWVLMGTVGLVLLIACANVANLMLVRVSGRGRELAIRASLGAGRGRIAQEMVVESLILGALGGALGIVFAYGGLRLLLLMQPANLPRLAEISIDPLVLGFLAGVSLLSALLFCFIPVVRQARSHLTLAIGGGGRTVSQSRERQRAQNTLVVVQVALALVLLAGAGLMIRSFQALLNVQPGFSRPEQVQLARISIPEAQAKEPERVIRMQNEILDRIAQVPGVISSAFTSAMPMEAGRSAIFAEGRTGEDQLPPLRVAKSISPGLFKTQGTSLIAGRDFTWTDLHEMRPVAIISESMAKETWGDAASALGKRIRIGNVGDWREIVGVAADVHDEGVHLKPSTTVYWRAGVTPGIMGAPPSAPRSVVFVIRSDRTGTESFIDEVSRAVWSVNDSLPLAQVRTLADVYDQSMARTSFTLVMLAIAAFMALALGMIGIYGVMSYTVSQRKREIGIRLALGATPGSLRYRFLRHGLLLAAAGVAIGLAAAMQLTVLLSSFLFGVQPLDTWTFAGVAVLLAVAAASASYLPARRASAVEPVEALKLE